MTVPLEAVVRATGARRLGALPPAALLGFSTDTRTLAPGDAFVALRGERFDGHAFVAEALAAGARLVVVSDASAVPAGAPALVVADTTDAYLAIAALARARSRARVVAITGSTGKTTTKAFLAQILERTQGGRVVATPANENNAFGVAKLLLSLPEDAAFVVVEFGARHFGEIAPLARAAAPEVAVLTNIGDAHLEIFGSAERLSETKWGIFATGARRVLSASDARSVERATQAPQAGRTTFFALDERPAVAAHHAALVLYGREQLAYDAAGSPSPRASQTFATSVRVPGDHNRYNAAAAAAAAFDLGQDGAAIAAALEWLELPPGRYERIELGAFALLYDAYNASLAGTLATLASFAREPAVRRIAVLGSMAELGAGSAGMHAQVGAAAAGKVDVLLVGGPYAEELAEGARAEGHDPSRIVPFARNSEAVGWLRQNAVAGDLVLLKASRRYKFEEIVAGLQSVHAG